jgi:branched-chain amino acid transport system permease protein
MTFIGKTGYVWLALGYASVVFVIIYALYHSRFGFFLRAQRDEPSAARSIGVNPERVRLVSGIVSAVLTAAGGTLYAQYLLFIDPEVAFSWNVSVQAALLGIIGGLGTLAGPILGAILLVPVERWLLASLGGSYGGLATMAYGLVLIAAVLLVPRGIASFFGRRAPRRRDTPEPTLIGGAGTEGSAQ